MNISPAQIENIGCIYSRSNINAILATTSDKENSHLESWHHIQNLQAW